MTTEAYKLHSRVFWIFLPNIIKIDPTDFELYRFKVDAFFETQCIEVSRLVDDGVNKRRGNGRSWKKACGL